MKHYTRRYTVLLVGVLLALFLALAGGAAAQSAPPSASPGVNGRIAFVNDRSYNSEIYTANPDGSGEIQLTHTQADEFDPAWSPDGMMLAFTRSYANNSWGIFLINANGGAETPLLSFPTYEGGEGHAAWSPDGEKIAFSCLCGNDQSEIFVMNADGSGVSNLTNHPSGDGDPMWSPDGAKIVFVSNREDGNNNGIYVMEADGSGQTMLSNSNDFAPAWSPDGDHIIFVSERDKNVNMNDEIYVMAANGSGQTRLTNNTIQDTFPAWSPDGTKIVFNRQRSGLLDIFVMNADGSQQVRLFNRRGNEFHPDWQSQPAGMFTFQPTNDSFVNETRPNGIAGTRPVLQVRDAAQDVNTYIKFNINSLTGTVQSATLRLWVIDPGPDGGAVYAVSPYYLDTTTLWLETGLKWNNAPAIAGAPLGVLRNAVKGQWVEVDVTAAVVAAHADNGRVSLAITNDSRNLVTYSSKEGMHPPELVVITN